MRRRVLILAGTVMLLTLVLAIPASASKPVDVSGWFGACAAGPLTYRTAGGNCIAEQFFACEMYGDLEGTMSNLVYIIDHGPCPPPGPGINKSNNHAHGTFAGKVCLGDDPDECRTGSFDWAGAAQWVPAEPYARMGIWRYAILKGYNGLEGLHGTLTEEVGLDGYEFYDTYEGQLHFN